MTVTTRPIGPITFILTWLLAWIAASGSEPLELEPLRVRLRHKVETIVQFGSRVPGYQGHEKAAEAIIREFRQLGLDNLIIDEFELATPIDRGASLSSLQLDEPVPLYPLWPNLVRCVTTGPQGLSGPLHYVGRGEYDDYNGLEVAGSIILMDFNSGRNYLKARDLGARAILLLEPENTSNYQAQQKVYLVPLNIPRLWVEAGWHERLLELARRGDQVTVSSRMEWQKVTCRNIYAELGGTDPQRDDERILLTTNYDSISVVPTLAPGGEQAGGLAALLELARYFKQHPPLRPLAFLATTARAQRNAGIEHFLIKHCAAENYKYHVAKIEPLPVPRGVDLKPRVIFGLDLASHSRTLGAFFQTAPLDQFQTDPLLQQKSKDSRVQMLSDYGMLLGDYSKRICEQYSWKEFYRNGISPIGGKGQRSHLPVALMLDSDIGSRLGHRFITLASCYDPRPLLDTPLDRPDRMDFASLAVQVRNLVALLSSAANDPRFISLGQSKSEMTSSKIRSLQGMGVKTVQAKLGEQAIANTPVPAALVVLMPLPEELSYQGCRPTLVAISNAEGRCAFRLANKIKRRAAFKINPDDGRIIFAADLGPEGHGTYPLDKGGGNTMVVMFRCRSLDFYHTTDPGRLKGLNKIVVMDSNNSEFPQYGTADISANVSEALGAVVFLPPGVRVKVGMGRGYWGFQYLLLGSRLEDPFGVGLSPEAGDAVFFSALRTAGDMALVNRSRMALLNKFGITDSLADEMIQAGQQSQAEAEAALARKDYAAYASAVCAARGFQSAAYPLLKAVANDTVKGIVFYFALLIPFAFFCERLLFGFADIKRQILVILAIFVLVFVVLRAVHPAFRVSTSPYMIFMAFTLLSIAALVLTIIVAKFNEQMAHLKRSADQVHHTDVGRISATLAAIMLGISSMKKRKLRTLLTTMTLVLLMFTVLSFTSVRSYTNYFKISLDKSPFYQGLLLRDRRWKDISPTFLEYAQTGFSPAQMARRAWFYLEFENSLSLPISRGGRSYDLSGVVGMEASEPEVSRFGSALLAGTWLTDIGEGDQIVVTSSVAEALGIGPEQVGKARVQMFGAQFLVQGIIDSELADGFRDLDNEPISPLEPFRGLQLREVSVKEHQADVEDRRSTALRAHRHMNGGQVAFINYERLMALGGRCKSLAIRPGAAVDVDQQIRSFLQRTTCLVFRSEKSRSYAYSAVGATGISGLSSLLVPILIAAFIVVNTIMGSVHDRRGEIHIYSSVGLAPVHISALFMAESAVYATLGAVVGYLLGQVVAKIVMVQGGLAGINLNYSSTSAVIATLLVMATVFLAAAYPSRMASKMAVPDVTRHWKFPDPQGDRWVFDFPFTVSSLQAKSLLMFLNNYFSSYREASVGKFFTRQVKFCHFQDEYGRALQLSMRVWLAPFDLGVSQGMQMSARPTEDEGISRIEVILTRLEGEHAAWQRLNRSLLREIRKQFLIYRTIPEANKEAYTEAADTVLGGT